MEDPYANGGILLDVRSPEETAAGHVKGALLIPIDELEARTAEVAAAVQGDLSRPVLVMCRLGRRAERGVQILRRRGFRRACNIGGIEVEPLRSMLAGLEAGNSSLDWARHGVAESARCYARWADSIRRGPPDYNALLGAYRHAYGAELNYRDAGIEAGPDGWGWRRAGELRRQHAATLQTLLGQGVLSH